MMASSEYKSTFSDESPTGQKFEAFRGLGRATIAARTVDSNDFAWLQQLRRDHLPVGVEPKAAFILEITKVNPAVQVVVNQNIGSTTIIIVDLSESYRSLFRDVFDHFGMAPPTRREAIDLMAKTELRSELSAALLQIARETSLAHSLIPRVESLLQEVVTQAGIPPAKAGVLVDRQALREMDQRSFQEFVARFSVAFGDALTPDRRRAAIIAALEGHQFLAPGYVAFAALGEAVRVDRFFDVGHADAFSKLQEAHDAIVKTLEEARERFFLGSVRGGLLKQEDSKNLLGIQAADIAARIAALEYERYPHDRLAGARALKQRFDRVLLNDQWV